MQGVGLRNRSGEVGIGMVDQLLVEGVKLASEVLKALMTLSMVLFGAIIAFMGSTYSTRGVGAAAIASIVAALIATAFNVWGLFACTHEIISGPCNASSPSIRWPTVGSIVFLIVAITAFGVHLASK